MNIYTVPRLNQTKASSKGSKQQQKQWVSRNAKARRKQQRAEIEEKREHKSKRFSNVFNEKSSYGMGKITMVEN